MGTVTCHTSHLPFEWVDGRYLPLLGWKEWEVGGAPPAWEAWEPNLTCLHSAFLGACLLPWGWDATSSCCQAVRLDTRLMERSG